jgi:O-antigen ligase
MELVGPTHRVPRERSFPSLRQCLVTVAAALGVVGVGALVAVAPKLALLLAVMAVIAGVLTRVRRVPVTTAVVVGALAVAATVDLPRQFTFGPNTMYAWITAGVGLLIAVIGVSRHVLSAVRDIGRVLWPLYAFGAWAVLSMVWFRPSFDGIQNSLVYIAFTTLVPVTAAAVIRGDLSFETARRAITWTILFASWLAVCSFAVGGMNSVIIGNRSYALVGVVGVAWGAAHARFGYRRIGLLAPLCWFLIIVSLSRLAFAASLLIIIVASIDVRSVSRFIKSLLVVVAVAGIAYFSVTSYGPLASRFRHQGDIKKVGGVSVDVTGRTNLWRITWHSYLRSPIVGHGAGSAETLIKQVRGSSGQPHSDYIRLLHDYGIIGMAAFAAAFAGLLRHSARATRAARKGDPAAPVHLAAGLAVLGLLVSMTTDNAIVYLFVVVPVAAIVGLSIGLTYRRQAVEGAEAGHAERRRAA